MVGEKKTCSFLFFKRLEWICRSGQDSFGLISVKQIRWVIKLGSVVSGPSKEKGVARWYQKTDFICLYELALEVISKEKFPKIEWIYNHSIHL